MNDLRSADDLTRDPQVAEESPPAFLDRPPKTNNPKELERKAIDDKARTLKQQNDLREVLGSQAGVRLMARILGDICFIDASAFHPNNSWMCNIAGRRQVAQQLKELIRECDFESWVKVDRELQAARPKSAAGDRSKS